MSNDFASSHEPEDGLHERGATISWGGPPSHEWSNFTKGVLLLCAVLLALVAFGS